MPLEKKGFNVYKHLSYKQSVNAYGYYNFNELGNKVTQ